MSKLPIRLRLTLAFALAMAAVLVLAGTFLYVRVASSLDETINAELQAQGREMAEVAREAGSGGRDGPGTGLQAPGERVAQLLDAGGRVVDTAPEAGPRPLLAPGEVTRALARGSFTVDRAGFPGMEGRARLLAMPIERPEGDLVLVLGASLEERDDALAELLGELLIVGPLALLLASLVGYVVAKAALRPVDSMQAEAAVISAAEPGRRLPLPRARDEVRRLGETLNDMLERLERALERERSFVADASHELRTPLALLRAELELALRRPRSPSELEQALRSAAAETEHLTRLAEDLLVLARADQGRLPLRPEPLSAPALLADVAERFAPEAEKAGRAIDVASADGLRVAADRNRLEQALANLVENALRHGEGTIELSAVERNGEVELHVADEGGGFPPEFVPRAFERFARADEARSGGGAGLGLAIVDAIAGAHGGSAHAANREDGGADVWISIPKA